MATLQIVEPSSENHESGRLPETVCQTLEANGIPIARLTPSQAAIQFADTHSLLNRLSLPENLPATILDGQLVLAGRYPDRRELTEWLNLDVEVLNVPRCCCGSGRRCCWCGRYYLEGKNL